MRRRDREMDREFGLRLIDEAAYGVLSINAASKPLSVPLSLVREEDTLYFHSAKEGEKVELFNLNPHVTITFVGDVRVPKLYTREELQALSEDPSSLLKLLSQVFTTEFESAIVKGRLEEISHDEKKEQVLKLLCQKFTPDAMDFVDQAIHVGMPKTHIYGVKIEELTAKRKKFGPDKRELKRPLK